MKRRTFLTAAAAMPLAAPAFARDDAMGVGALYDGPRFSPLVGQLLGQRITVSGYMAPPLKANSQFFVLSKDPMAVCPFCDDASDWPENILAVYTKRVVEPVYFARNIEARGVLAIGPFRDEETGFLSMMRLTDATYG